jgi:hypothetical protein
MRLSDLLGSEVLDAGGSRVGIVADLVLVQDGPMLGPYGASFRGSALIVVERRHVRLLGYERDLKPLVLRWLVHRLSGGVRQVPGEQVQRYDEGQSRLRASADALSDYDPATRRR